MSMATENATPSTTSHDVHRIRPADRVGARLVVAADQGDHGDHDGGQQQPPRVTTQVADEEAER
jgi:hypothetical protein